MLPGNKTVYKTNFINIICQHHKRNAKKSRNHFPFFFPSFFLLYFFWGGGGYRLFTHAVICKLYMSDLREKKNPILAEIFTLWYCDSWQEGKQSNATLEIVQEWLACCCLVINITHLPKYNISLFHDSQIFS